MVPLCRASEFHPSVSSLFLDCSFVSEDHYGGLEPGQTIQINPTVSLESTWSECVLEIVWPRSKGNKAECAYFAIGAESEKSEQKQTRFFYIYIFGFLFFHGNPERALLSYCFKKHWHLTYFLLRFTYIQHFL